MRNIVLESLEACIARAGSLELQKCAATYVRKTSGCFLENNINFVSALFGGGPYTEDVEPEIDLLIEISSHRAEERALLIHELGQTLEKANDLLKKRASDSKDDSETGDFTWEESRTWDAVRKLYTHLMTMRMELKNEKPVRTLLPSICENGGYKTEDLLGYLAKNPSAMEFRTSETILHLACSIVDIVRTGARSGHQYKEADAEKLERLMPVRKRTPLWFESFVPQHDGWALAIGDDLECVPPEEAGEWIRLFDLARQGNTPKPSKAFLKAAVAFRSEINEPSFTAMFNHIEAAMRGVSPVPVWDGTAYYSHKEESTYAPSSVGMLRGLIRIASFYSSPRTFLSLERIMERCFEKIIGTGPRCEPLGQEALDSMASMEIEGKLDRFQQALLKFKSNKNVKKRLTKAILKAGGSV